MTALQVTSTEDLRRYINDVFLQTCTMSDLARMSGVHRSKVHNFVRNKTTLQADNLFALMNAVNVVIFVPTSIQISERIQIKKTG